MALGISLVYAIQRFPNVSQGGLVAAGVYATYAFGSVTVGLEFILDHTISLVWGNSLRTYDVGLGPTS